MTKYFYTDPIAAAFMVREYGVEVTANKEGGGQTEPITWDLLWAIETIRSEEDYERYYVHPDSHHIFEPQVGDFYQDEDPNGISIERITKVDKIDKTYEATSDYGNDAHWYYGEELPKIIQRNGNPFFAPEVE